MSDACINERMYVRMPSGGQAALHNKTALDQLQHTNFRMGRRRAEVHAAATVARLDDCAKNACATGITEFCCRCCIPVRGLAAASWTSLTSCRG